MTPWGWSKYSIAFGAVHILNFKTENFIPLLSIFLVLPQIFGALVLGYIRIFMGLRWSILFHALHNLYFLILLFINHWTKFMTHPYQFKSKYFVETINVSTAVFFILFSILKRFTEEDKLMIIPLILFSANFLILIEFGYKNY